jgi:hypothetical protein
MPSTEWTRPDLRGHVAVVAGTTEALAREQAERGREET